MAVIGYVAALVFALALWALRDVAVRAIEQRRREQDQRAADSDMRADVDALKVATADLRAGLLKVERALPAAMRIKQ